MREISSFAEAEECFRRIVDLDPTDADALFHLGALVHRRSDFQAAARAYRAALEQTPKNPHLWIALGGVLGQDVARLEEAIRATLAAIEIEPGLAEAHFRLGLLLRRRSDYLGAKAALLRALELEPGLVDARNALGNLLQDEGELDQAMQQYQEAIRRSPDDPESHNNFGCALARCGDLDQAVGCFERAVDLRPDFADAHLNLANVFSLQGRHDRALRSSREAYRLRPDDLATLSNMVFEMQHVCEWSDYQVLVELRRKCAAQHADAVAPPFHLLASPSAPAEQFLAARSFARRYSDSFRQERDRYDFRERHPIDRKLRIGYLSADFHDHVSAYVMAEMFELHDRTGFHVTAYSYGPDDGSAMRARMKGAFDKFVDLSGYSHQAAADAVYTDRVDILVDLKGYTQLARTEIVALRPAPIQVAYMGYPGTLAADFIDYLVADRYVIPADQVRHYGEQLVFLPSTYYVNDRKRLIGEAPGRAQLQLPEHAFVFCCFNQTYKILPAMFSIWMRLLNAIGGSVLWLLDTNPWAKENLRREALAHGISPERIVFAPRVRAELHLGRLRAADLFLDTLPYNAHTTATDALWVGVPVLTCSGQTFASRVAGSLLSALDVPELIAGSLAEYENRAIGLARAPEELAALRKKIRCNRDATPLFDTPRFTRDLERAYALMWENYAAGNPPRTFGV